VIGLIMAVPLVRYLFYPVGRKVVSSSGEPIDAIGLDELEVGGPPVRVELVGDDVRDAWLSADRTKLGAAWVQRTEGDEVVAFSSVCPHLGCSINFDDGAFRCPCHNSEFDRDGARVTGPAKRGLDPLPVRVSDGRVRVTFKAFKPDVSERVEASAGDPRASDRHEHPA
jgi:Rieske Fe-S protein